MRPPARSSAAAARWPAAASGSHSRWPRAPCVGARRTCVPPRKYWLARTRIRGVAPRTNPPSLFSCAPHLQPTVTGRQGRSCANNRWAIPEHQSGPLNNIEAIGVGKSPIVLETSIGAATYADFLQIPLNFEERLSVEGLAAGRKLRQRLRRRLTLRDLVDDIRSPTKSDQ